MKRFVVEFFALFVGMGLVYLNPAGLVGLMCVGLAILGMIDQIPVVHRTRNRAFDRLMGLE